MDHGGGAVELVIPARILDSDIFALVIEFVGDICVARRYTGAPTHSMTFLLTYCDQGPNIGNSVQAVEVNAWRYLGFPPFGQEGGDRTGLACELCEDDRGAHFRASVCSFDLLLYKQRTLLPVSYIVRDRLRRPCRLENKDICDNCLEYIYTVGIAPINPRYRTRGQLWQLRRNSYPRSRVTVISPVIDLTVDE